MHKRGNVQTVAGERMHPAVALVANLGNRTPGTLIYMEMSQTFVKRLCMIKDRPFLVCRC